MKNKIAISALALLVSASAFAVTPAKYDTKFNVSANVPEGAYITSPDGTPVTDVDIELIANAASGKMEAMSPELALWNNDATKLDVSLVMDDATVATGNKFSLTSTQDGRLQKMTYSISTLTNGPQQTFTNSGDSKDFALTANGAHGELPIIFHFVSDADYKALGQGYYTGVVYANVNAKP